MRQTAVCARCGSMKTTYTDACSGCGHRPAGEGLLVAWLLSEDGPYGEKLSAVAERIQSGGAIRPSRRMLQQARVALGADFSTDPGLSSRQRLALLATSLFLTPLVGWVLFAWWRGTRPRASIQALGLSLPVTVLFTLAVVWLRNGG